MTWLDRTIGDGAARLTQACLTRPGWALFILAFALAAALGGATRLRFDPGAEAYFAGTEAWQFERRVEATFGTGDTVVVAFRERRGTIFDVESIEAVRELDRILARRSDVARVVSIASARALRRTDPDAPIDVGPMVQGPLDRAAAARLGEILAAHPVYGGLLVDAAHETTFMFVQLVPALDQPASRRAWVRAVRAEVDRFATAHRSVHLAGAPVTEEAIAQAVARDAGLFFTAALILCTLLLGLVFSDLRAAAMPLSVVSGSALFITGTLALLGLPLDVATATVPTLVLVVGLAHGVHFLAELKAQAASSASPEAALIETSRAIAFPCALASLTSGVGFLALLTSELRPLRVLGVATAAGLFVAYLATFLLGPVLLRALGLPKLGASAFPAAPALGRRVRKLAELGQRKLLMPLALLGIGFGVSFAALGRLEVDADITGYLGESGRLRRDLAVMEQALGGVDGLSVVLEAPTDGWFRSPEGLAALDQIARDLRNLEGVGRAFGPADYLRVGQSVLEGVPPLESPSLSVTADEVAQLSLLDPETLGALLGPDGRLARVTLQLPSLSSREIDALADLAAQSAKMALGDHDVAVRVTGRPLLFSAAVRRVLEEASRSFTTAAIAIFIVLAIGLGSLSLAGLAMIPNVLTLGLGFAVMVALGFDFDVHAAFVACVGMGVAVDDTLHLIVRYRRARTNSGRSAGEAMEAAVTRVGHPILLTSLILVVGFSVLWLSNFAPTMRMGVLSSVVVVWAVVIDLGLLPPLLLAGAAVAQHLRKAT